MRPHDLAAVGIEGVQPVAGGEPDMLAVEGDAVHLVDAGKGAVLAEDFGRACFIVHSHCRWQRS